MRTKTYKCETRGCKNRTHSFAYCEKCRDAIRANAKMSNTPVDARMS